MKKTNNQKSGFGRIVFGTFLIFLLAFAACQQTPPLPIPDNGQGNGGVIPDTNNQNTNNIKTSKFEFDYNSDESIEVKKFTSEEEFSAFLLDMTGSGGGYGGGMMFRGDVDFAMAESANDGAMIKTTGGAIPQAAPDFSGTNNQVANVDEGDILKTDGNYIYTITDNTLFIVKAYPGEEAEIVSKTKFDNRPRGLFINGDKLVVFGDLTDLDTLDDMEVRVRHGMSFFEVYDISNKKYPELEKGLLYEGSYFNSRMIGDEVYFVTSVYPEYRHDPLPIIIEDDVVRTMPVDDIFFFNIPYRNPYFVGIHSINLDNFEGESKMLAVEGYPNMYMSEDNMFITYTERINEWELRQDIIQDILEPEMPSHYKRIIQKIKETDSEVLNRYEKESKIQSLYNEYLYGMSQEKRDDINDLAENELKKELEKFEYMEFTVINKINVNNGDIKIESNGKVPGSVINQFSMDEYDDVFRMGTTVSPRWSRFAGERSESTNNVYTLNEDLEIIGKIENIAKGERIFSTRFIEDKLYMVTFRQVDPFFVIDLSDPENPEELGELKIPGFSRYLHPYDENTIIGIGREATDTGRQQGLKISLFDVSDVKNPKEVAKFVSEERYSRSSAEYEHKAFLFSKEKNLLVIPVYSYNYENEDDNYNGAFVFDIDTNDIELRGLIDHSMANNNRYWSPSVERSLYIDDLLYTKSPNLLRINELEDLSSVKNIDLDPVKQISIPVY